jgi:nucleotide-binding universal stress UspA family protein
MRRFSRILACTDFSEVGNRAVEMAFGLAHGSTTCVLLVHVLDPPAVLNPMYANLVSTPGWAPEQLEVARTRTARALEALAPAGARDLGIGIETRTPHGHPADEVLRLAEEERVDVVVMGTHGRTGLERFLLGSVTERVVRMATCAVMVVH